MLPLASGPTLATLTSGALSSALTVVGSLFVVGLTIRHDRRVQSQQASARAAADDEARRRNAARALQAVLPAVLSETRWAPFTLGKAQKAFLDAVVIATAEVGRNHPDVTAWLIERYEDVAADTEAWRRGWWKLWGNSALTESRARLAGDVTGTMVRWAAGRIDDTWFAERLTADRAT